jgi:hypothetical protein
MIGTWHHTIQFTPPRGSLKDAEALLAEVGSTFLRDLPARVRRRARSRTTAARIAADLMFRAVQERLPNRAKELIGKNGELSGHLESHRVDVILGNGRPIAAVQALSFEGADSPSLQREVDTMCPSCAASCPGHRRSAEAAEDRIRELEVEIGRHQDRGIEPRSGYTKSRWRLSRNSVAAMIADVCNNLLHRQFPARIDRHCRPLRLSRSDAESRRELARFS